MAVKKKEHKRNFNKRFGDRISVTYANKPTGVRELQMRNTKLYRAFIDVLSGILGREPTQKEILGIDDLSKRGSTFKSQPP